MTWSFFSATLTTIKNTWKRYSNASERQTCAWNLVSVTLWNLKWNIWVTSYRQRVWNLTQTKFVQSKSFQFLQTPLALKHFFRGLCNYYRRFIKGFAKIASPLNKLTSKHAQFKWNADCQTAFETLKRALVSAPVLAYPDFNLSFYLYVDASQTGIGLTDLTTNCRWKRSDDCIRQERP